MTASQPESSTLLGKSLDFVRQKVPRHFEPEIALLLGSGLANLAKSVKPICTIPYREIPGFVAPAVAGHRGELILGEIQRKKVLVLSGRIHYYEGYPLSQTVYPIRMAGLLGVKTMILTSAVGAIAKGLRASDLVAIKDHINFMGANPLRGIHNPEFGERFPDMSECYSRRLVRLAIEVARKNKISLREAQYFASSGPSYETPAEIRAFRMLGGDVVGMSMVPEAIVARQMGMEVLGLSYVANLAAGIKKSALSHDEVLEVGLGAGKKLSFLIGEILKKL